MRHEESPAPVIAGNRAGSFNESGRSEDTPPNPEFQPLPFGIVTAGEAIAGPMRHIKARHAERSRLNRKLARLHRIGPRPMSELVLELGSNDLPALESRIDDYLRVSPAAYVATGADRMAPSLPYAVHP